MLVNQSMDGRELGEIVLRINRPMRLGDVLTNVFDLLNQTQCSQEYRAYLVEYPNRTSSQNRSLISSYFELNAYTGDLTLKQDLIESKLTQNVQLVHGSRLDALLSSARLFRLDIEIGRAYLNQISLKETDDEHEVQGELPEERPIRLRLAYDRLTRNRSSQLILSELGSYFGRSYTYLIEAVYVNKSISDGFDIVLSNTIRLVDNYNSLVRVDNQRLVLTLNVTEFLRLNLFRFDFTVVKLRELNAHQPDARIRYQIELDFSHNVQYLLDYMGYRQLVVEKHIHSDTARIGQVVFDLNQTLFDGNYFGQHLTFRLESTSPSSLPFSVDPSNGNLILTNDLLKSRRRVFEFGVEMSDLFTIRFKIRVLVKQPITTGEIQVSYSEIQRLKVSKYCRENHLIGSVNNLADGRADGEFFFLLKNYHNLIRLNRTSGELTCASQFSEQSTSDYVVKIEIDVFKRRYSAYVKTILLYLEIYNLDRNQFYLSSIYNERLIFEITMSDRDIVWNVPAMISQRYETCLIIAGNYGSRFYLNQQTFQLELIPELEPSRVDEYQLLIRCFSVNYEEIDIQLNVQIANGSAAVDQIDLDAPLHDTDLHEVNLNVENFRNDDPLIKLNVTWAEFEQSTDGLVGFFQSLLRLDKHTGEIRVNLADFNKYHEYCRLVERGRVKINYVLTVRVRLGSVNSSILLRVSPNCLGTDVNLTFKRPVYMLTLRHTDRLNRPLGSVSVVDDVRSIYSVAYYFCTPNGLFELSDIDDPPLLRVDKTSGLIYLQRLVDLVEFQHREYKLCAALESKLFKSTVLVESQLLVKIDPPKDTLALSTFDGQTPLSVNDGPITLTFPYEQLGHHRRFTAANQLNLFKLDPVKNGFFSLLTTSSHLIHVDSVTGWIRLDKSRITSHRTQPQIHSVRVSVASRNLPLTRLVYIDLQLNFVKTRPVLDLFIPFYTQVGSKLIDVKRYLHSNEHRFLVMHGAELPCSDCVYFNPNDGFVYLLKPIQLTQLNRSFKFTLRYTSDECDFDILKINVQFYKHANNLSVTSRPKFDIYISAMSPIGSVVYDTFSPIRRIFSDYGSFFGVEHSKLLIGRNLTSLLDECPVEINVMTESESITLNVYLIERVSQNVQFARLNYYVEYGIKFDESGSTHELVRLELSEPKLVQFDSNIARIGELKCLGDKYEYSIDAEQVYEFFTVIPDVDYYRVFVNNKRVVDYSCDFYKLTVELTPKIKTQVYVEIVNFSQLKFLSLFSDLDERHNRTLNATTSLTQQLDVYQLLGVKKQLIELKPDLMWSDQSPVQEFTFTPDDGFITFNIGYNLSKPVYRIRIDLIGYKQLNDQIVVKKFQLCLFVVYNSEFKYRPLFGRDSIDVRFDLAPGAVINPVDLRTYMYRDGQRGVRFSLANNDLQLVRLDQLTGEVSLNEALASKYVFFLNVSRPVQITACSETDDCDSITVHVNVNSRPSTNVYDHLKRFYAATSTRQSMKLRKFGDTINRYDLYKTGSELIDLNYSNGLLTGRLADDLELTLVYNNTMLIKFKIPGEPVRSWARANASSKFDDLSVDLNVRTWGRSTLGYYLTSLNRFDPRYGCELWNTVRDDSSFALDSNCDLYVRDRADERLQLGVRIYDTRRVFKSTLIRVQVAVNRIGFNLSRLLFIEYEKSNGKSLEGLYGYFKRDRIISSPITLHQEFDNDVHLVALESSRFEMDKIFANGLESQLVKLESDLNVRVRSVYSSNMCFFHLKQQNHACHLNNFFRPEDSSSNFIPFYQRLLETNTTLVRIPDSKANMIRLGANDLTRQKLTFKNRIKFNRLNYIRYDGFNLTYEGYMSLKVSFRYLDAVYSNTNMIFHSDLLVGEARGYFVNMEMVQSKLEIKHNLLSNKRRSVLSLDHELKQNRWYQVQLQIVQNELSVELKQWNMRTVQDLSQRKKVKLADDLSRAFSSGFQVDRMFIGGLNERLSTTNTFYSDEFEVADISLNNYELLDRQLIDYKSAVLVLNEPQDLNDKRDQYCAANVYSSNCDRALGSLSLGRSSSFRIDFNMKPHYWQFVQLEKTSQNGLGFNLTLVFHFDHQLNPTDNKEIILLRSENSLLQINPVKIRLELKTNNRLVAWIPVPMPNRHNSSSSDQQLYKLTILAWNVNKTKMMLNQQQRVFDASSMELFTSPYIRLVFSQIEPLIQVCLRSIHLNNDRLSMFDGASKYFISRTWMPGSTSQLVYGSCSSKNEPVYNDVNKNFNLVGEDLGDAADKAPSLIIITVLITSFVALVAILSILVNIYLRSKMSKTTSRRTMFKQAIPVVGKNQFEISMNTSSQQNSPVPSEICSLSTNNSFSQYAVKPAALNNSTGRIKPIIHEKMIEKAKNECILNCLNLEDNTTEGNYFTCDTIKMSTFNLVGQPEFVFKRVNLNKNYHNVEQTMVRKADDKQMNDSSASVSFDANDLNKLKSMLNWTPTLTQFDELFDEFEKFIQHEHVCKNDFRPKRELEYLPVNTTINSVNQTNSTINLYENCEKHTFV